MGGMYHRFTAQATALAAMLLLIGGCSSYEAFDSMLGGSGSETYQPGECGVLDSFSQAPSRFRFIAGVADFAEKLRNSPYARTPFEAVEAVMVSSMNAADERDVEVVELVKKVGGME